MSCEHLFNKAVAIIHPYDRDLMKFLTIFQSKLSQAGHYPRCLDVTKLMLINRYQNLPTYDWNIGIEELNAAKFCSILGFYDEAEEHIVKAKDILQVNFGFEHPLLTKELKPIHGEILLHVKTKKGSLHPPQQIWNTNTNRAPTSMYTSPQ